MTRLSNFLLPTVKEPPADAEAVSHRLLLRAGLARQVGAGLWTYLPAGWRVHRKVEQIIREEMDRIGTQEMLMPVLQPAELWRKTGRYDLDELFKLKDRKGSDYVLGMTHEEVITFHMSREVRSYRDLPMMLYHIQIKERDEPRPRAGLLRTREFIMKDAYTFDRDREGLDAQYELQASAYDRIFERAGLERGRTTSRAATPATRPTSRWRARRRSPWRGSSRATRPTRSTHQEPRRSTRWPACWMSRPQR
jgi:prolyl-tRNA synthetase